MSETWHPDVELRHAARAGTVRLLPLGEADRAWAVASLVCAGYTASRIAEMLDCSLRIVAKIKAEPICDMAVYAVSLLDKIDHERGLRKLVIDISEREKRALEDDLQRCRKQCDVLAEQHYQDRGLRRGKTN